MNGEPKAQKTPQVAGLSSAKRECSTSGKPGGVPKELAGTSSVGPSLPSCGDSRPTARDATRARTRLPLA